MRILLVLLALLAVLPLRPVVAAPDADLAPGRVVVKLRDGRPARAAQATYGALGVEDRPGLGQVWHVPPGREAEVARSLASDPAVEYAEPDRIARLYAAPGDPLYGPYQWNLPKIGAPEAWQTTTGRADVTVAVIDSGFDPGHPDRPASLALGCDYVRWRVTSYRGDCPAVAGDPNGHGTHVAGIVGARANNGVGISGVAPDVTVLVIRTADASGASYVSDVAAAIYEAVDRGARVINLSLGGPTSTSAQRNAVEYARQRGVLVVAAMGNDYRVGSPTSYPAAYPGVVAVGAATHDDRHADYSSTGAHISLVAPGGGGDSAGEPRNWITSLFPVASGEYRLVVGTSQAAPHVAAVAGLMLSARPGLGAAEAADLLRATARPLGVGRPNPTFGYGYLDAAAAVRAARGGAPAPVATPEPTATPAATPQPAAAPPPTQPPGWHRQQLPLLTRGFPGV